MTWSFDWNGKNLSLADKHIYRKVASTSIVLCSSSASAATLFDADFRSIFNLLYAAALLWVMSVVSTGDQKGVMIYFNSQQFKGVLEGRKPNAIALVLSIVQPLLLSLLYMWLTSQFSENQCNCTGGTVWPLLLSAFLSRLSAALRFNFPGGWFRTDEPWKGICVRSRLHLPPTWWRDPSFQRHAHQNFGIETLANLKGNFKFVEVTTMKSRRVCFEPS